MAMKNNHKAISIPMGVTLTAILMGITLATILIVASAVTTSQMISASATQAKMTVMSGENLESTQVMLSSGFQQVGKSELSDNFAELGIPTLVAGNDPGQPSVDDVTIKCSAC